MAWVHAFGGAGRCDAMLAPIRRRQDGRIRVGERPSGELSPNSIHIELSRFAGIALCETD